MIRGSLCSKSRLAKTAGAEVGVPQKHEKWHAAVVRSTFYSQNAQNTTFAEQFLNFRCREIVRYCGAKHICKSKCTKHHFWRSDRAKWHAAVARSTFARQNVRKLRGSDHFLKLRCRKISQSVSYSQSIIQSVSQLINQWIIQLVS